MLLTPDDGTELYAFELSESTVSPKVEAIGEVGESLTGVAIYSSDKEDYILAAETNIIQVLKFPFESIGTIEVTGIDEIEIEGLSVHQQATKLYPEGAIAYAAEADDFEGFALSSLEGVLGDLNIKANTDYDPHTQKGCRQRNPVKEECSFRGFWDAAARSCECFAGSVGKDCSWSVCPNNCAGHGECIGPNQCKCDSGWGGLYCSFLLVQPLRETDAKGADGDDPAIWISPTSPERSRIVTTTKSEEGAGLTVYDLNGNELQAHYSAQPNNVDIIYGFKAGERIVDLAFAACRGDNTLW